MVLSCNFVGCGIEISECRVWKSFRLVFTMEAWFSIIPCFLKIGNLASYSCNRRGNLFFFYDETVPMFQVDEEHEDLRIMF